MNRPRAMKALALSIFYLIAIVLIAAVCLAVGTGVVLALVLLPSGVLFSVALAAVMLAVAKCLYDDNEPPTG